MYIVALVDRGSCNGCRACIRSCPEPNAIAFAADEKKVVVVAERCKGCGLCMVHCNRESITMVSVIPGDGIRVG